MSYSAQIDIGVLGQDRLRQVAREVGELENQIDSFDTRARRATAGQAASRLGRARSVVNRTDVRDNREALTRAARAQVIAEQQRLATQQRISAELRRQRILLAQVNPTSQYSRPIGPAAGPVSTARSGPSTSIDRGRQIQQSWRQAFQEAEAVGNDLRKASAPRPEHPEQLAKGAAAAGRS